jgi:hypothetical protein
VTAYNVPETRIIGGDCVVFVRGSSAEMLAGPVAPPFRFIGERRAPSETISVANFEQLGHKIMLIVDER